MRLILPVLLVFLAGALAVRFFFAHADERAIRRVFADVCENMRKEGTEHPFQTMAKARAVARHAAARIRLEGPGSGNVYTLDTADLAERLAALRREAAFLSVTVSDLTVRFPEPDGDVRAEAFCNLTVNGLSQTDTFAGGDAFALTTSFEKDPDSGAWRVAALHAAPLVPQE